MTTPADAPAEPKHRYHILSQYEGVDSDPATTMMRYIVTNVPVPEKTFDCDNYRLAVERMIASSAWFPRQGWQLGLPEEELARVAMDAVVDAANKLNF